MRKFLSFLTMFMLISIISFAQTRTVSGRVADAAGKGIAFASVIARTGGGGNADANGDFSVRVKSGDALTVSHASYNSVTIPVTESNYYNVVLTLKENTIPEVVVTGAFNIKRTARSLSSGTQTLQAEQINTIRQQNVNEALAGKVAGMQVQSVSAAKLGSDNKVRLRGENGFGVGGGALYVVDGTIIPSAGDINTDDIEDVNVLQGTAATALFGSAGSNGAIVITTKKGRKNVAGLGLEINTSAVFDKVYILPNYQNSYAGGTYDPNNNTGQFVKYNYRPGVDPAGWKALDGKYYISDIEDESWGPRMVGQEYIPWYAWYGGHEDAYKTAKLLPQPNNARDYFNTGVGLINNINFSKGGDDYSLRFSYTNYDQKGLIPTSYLKRNTFNTTASLNISPKFTVASNITYMIQKQNAENDDGYSNNTTGSFNQWFHRDLDMGMLQKMRYYRNDYGQLATWNHSTPDAYNPNNPQAFYAPYYWFSPYSWQDNVYNGYGRNRLYGDASITYKPLPDFSLKFTYRLNNLITNSDTKIYNVIAVTNAGKNSSGFNYWESISGRSATWQGFGYSNTNSMRQNYEVLASYRKKLKNWNFGANAGIDIFRADYEGSGWNSLGGLIVPDEFLVSNSVKTNPQSRQIIREGRRSPFVRADIGFKNYAFLDASYRRDYSSTEENGKPVDTRAVGASLILSDIFGFNNSFLNYFKVRASIGELLNSLSPYQNSVLYPATDYPVSYNGNVRIATLPNRTVQGLHGASNVEKELGFEMRFWKSRFTLNTTYWDRTNKDFPYDVTISPYSGFSSWSTNVGEMRKKGLDVQASFNLFKGKNVDYTIGGAWGYLIDNDVISIAPGVKQTAAISSGQAGTNAYVLNEEGLRWGQLVGRGILMIDGKPVLKETSGLYEVDPILKHYGSVLPKYTGGIQNSLILYKNFTLNANIDFSYGGKFFSLSKYYGYATGLMAETAVLNDKGNPVRDRVADGGGVHVVGVDASGTKTIDRYVEAGEYFRQFAYGGGIVEPMIQDLTFVKLREFSIGYKIPVEKIGLSRYMKAATFSVVARNSWLIYSGAPGFDPSEIATNYGEDGQLPGTRSVGVSLKLAF